MENLQLTSSELVELKEEAKDEIKHEAAPPIYCVQTLQGQDVNSQFLDINVKPACYNEEEIETDEDLDQL